MRSLPSRPAAWTKTASRPVVPAERAHHALCNQTIWPRPFCGEKHRKIRATGPSLGMKMLDILLSFATCRSLLRLSQAPPRPQALDTHPGEEHGNGGQRSRRSDDKHREQNLLGVPPREGDLQPANWFQSNLACSRRNIGFQRPNFLRRSTSAWLTSPAATKACTQVWDRLRPFLSMQVLSAALSSPYSLQWA